MGSREALRANAGPPETSKIGSARAPEVGLGLKTKVLARGGLHRSTERGRGSVAIVSLGRPRLESLVQVWRDSCHERVVGSESRAGKGRYGRNPRRHPWEFGLGLLRRLRQAETWPIFELGTGFTETVS